MRKTITKRLKRKQFRLHSDGERGKAPVFAGYYRLRALAVSGGRFNMCSGGRNDHIKIACVASVSVRFRSKERGTRVKHRSKNGVSRRATLIFWLSFHFSRGQNRESRYSVFLCSETKRKRLLRRLLWKKLWRSTSHTGWEGLIELGFFTLQRCFFLSSGLHIFGSSTTPFRDQVYPC